MAYAVDEEKQPYLLCYALGWLTGLWLMKTPNPKLRFHAAQSIVVFGGLSALFLLGSAADNSLFMLIRGVAILGGIGLWLALLYTAYQGNPLEVPVAADYARKLADRMKPAAAQDPVSPVSPPAAQPAAQAVAQPAAQPFPGAPNAPNAPFNPLGGNLIYQLCDQIGYWRANDAIQALGQPASHADQGGLKVDNFSYPSPDGRPYSISLGYAGNGLLAVIVVHPHDLTAAEISYVIGNQASGQQKLPDGTLNVNFNSLALALQIDSTGAVIRILLRGREAKGLFSQWSTWAKHLP